MANRGRIYVYKTTVDEGQNLFVKEKCVALDILADVASPTLQQEEKNVKEKEKEATQQWKIYGVSGSLKIVIKRVQKSDSMPSISKCDFLAASKVGNTSTVSVTSPTKRCIEDIEVGNVHNSKLEIHRVRWLTGAESICAGQHLMRGRIYL